MFSFETAFKKLIIEAIVEAYDKIKDGEVELAPADGKPEAVEAPMPSTRKRRTKAEIEADAKAELEGVVASASVADKKPTKAKSEITYDQLKQAVFEYVLEHGKPAAEKILGQFGVTQAQKLQPEQWDEAYALFEAASQPDQDIA